MSTDKRQYRAKIDALIEEGLQKGILRAAPEDESYRQLIGAYSKDPIVSQASPGLGYEEVLQKLDHPLFDYVSTQDNLLKMWSYLINDIARQINPAVEGENSIAAWYRKAKEIRGVALQNVYAYLEADPEFIMMLMNHFQEYNSQVASKAIKSVLVNIKADMESKWAEGLTPYYIVFFGRGFFFRLYAVVAHAPHERIFLYDNYLVNIAEECNSMGFEFDFSGNKYPVSKEMAEEIIDAYFICKEEALFTQNCNSPYFVFERMKNSWGKINVTGINE